jgi:nicotinate-nucleotide pyrophosphorylase (carboxylating)
MAWTMATEDTRELILRQVERFQFQSRITVQANGILSGMQMLQEACGVLGINVTTYKENGDEVRAEDVLALLKGNARQMALGEEELIGWIGKSSGIATAAWKAKMIAGNHLKVVSGAWKKMPPSMKELVRQAIMDGGIHYRISDRPFIYLDKNYVTMLGGVKKAISAVKDLKHFTLTIQLKSEGQKLLREATLAAQMGAHIIMIDTGRREDIDRVDLILRERQLRHGVKIAFGGDIRIEELNDLRRTAVDIVDIGKAIVDAPVLDMRMDVLKKA